MLYSNRYGGEWIFFFAGMKRKGGDLKSFPLPFLLCIIFDDESSALPFQKRIWRPSPPPTPPPAINFVFSGKKKLEKANNSQVFFC